MKSPMLEEQRLFSPRESGFSLIQVLVVIGVLSFMAVSMMLMSSHMILRKPAVDAAGRAEIDAFRRNFPVLIMDDIAWNETVRRNPTMACLTGRNGLNCPANKQRTPFTLYDAIGAVVYTGSPFPNTNGLTAAGVPCGPAAPAVAPYNQYQYPSPDCPFQYKLEWAAMTRDPVPLVAVIITLEIGKDAQQVPYTKMLINPELYSFTFKPNPGWPPPSDRWPSAVLYRHAIAN